LTQNLEDVQPLLAMRLSEESLTGERHRMQSVADLLRRALQIGDEQRRVTIRRWHLPENLVSELASRTHEHAVAHADSADNGWLTFRDGIERFWSEEANLTKGEFGRLFHLRTDVVKQLTDWGVAYRSNPRSTVLYVRRRSRRPGRLPTTRRVPAELPHAGLTGDSTDLP
jgi:hypothetical protein